MRDTLRGLVCVCLWGAAGLVFGTEDLRTVDLGECPLAEGGVLKPCVLGFRTAGTLNEARDNTILVPTWFGGTSEWALAFATAYIDTDSFYIISVDAFANGISTSPSNSPTQGGKSFPKVTISDMVAAQYRLVTEVLELDQLYAVTGASMGGMQTFEWMVAYPGFFKKAVPLIGSPKLGPYDITLWNTQWTILDYFDQCQCEAAARMLASLGQLMGTSPLQVDNHQQIDRLQAQQNARIENMMQRPSGWVDNTVIQLQAMISHDISERFGMDMASAADATTAELLSVVVSSDHVVTPWSAIRFTELKGGTNVVIDDPAGHGAIFESRAGFERQVRSFLSQD